MYRQEARGNQADCKSKPGMPGKERAMETIYEGRRYYISLIAGAFRLQSSSGKHYCQDGCSYCEESTPGNDAHYYECAFPESSFTDDLGNKWEYNGVIRHDESNSFGWWDDTHQWTLHKGGKKSGAFQPADPINIQKIRRRIEDRLRKSQEHEIIEIAIRLGVSLA